MIYNEDVKSLFLSFDEFRFNHKDEKIRVNVDYYTEFTLITLDSDNDKNNIKISVNDSFENSFLPFIVLYFISNNTDLVCRKLIANDSGNIIFENDDFILIVRNISIKAIEMLSLLNNNYNILKSEDECDSSYKDFIETNISIIYSYYRKDFYDVTLKANFFDKNTYKTYLESRYRDDDVKDQNFLILDIARCLCALNESDGIEIIKEQYKEDVMVVNLAENFYDVKFNSIYEKALRCARFENLNESLLIRIKDMVLEVMGYVKDAQELDFEEYFDGRARFYRIFENTKFENICNAILNSRILSGEDNMEDVEIISTEKERIGTGFKEIINNPIKEEPLYLFQNKEQEALAKAGEEQARLIMDIIEEKNSVKKDAEEFAKIILRKQKEYREIVMAADEQAKRIVELERENEKLKALAEENAMNIFLRDRKNDEEIYLRNIKDETPISSSDVDKINNLLNALSSVKDIDFVINHPTVAQEVYVLEEKIVTYLSTHNNVKEEEKEEVVDLAQSEENKTPIELLSIVRNVYLASHNYEKDGRHSVLDVSPYFDKYRVVVYSVKDDSYDILTDVYFDKMFFNEDVIKELCDIYSDGATIIASKTDNIPDNLADFLVIDNMDNALKFTGCSRYIIQIAKAYL